MRIKFQKIIIAIASASIAHQKGKRQAVTPFCTEIGSTSKGVTEGGLPPRVACERGRIPAVAWIYL